MKDICCTTIAIENNNCNNCALLKNQINCVAIKKGKKYAVKLQLLLLKFQIMIFQGGGGGIAMSYILLLLFFNAQIPFLCTAMNRASFKRILMFTLH